jgi:putative permease
MKRLAWFTTIILATLTGALLFWEFRAAVVLFIVSLVIAATVRPLVDWFAARRVPRGVALLLAYALCVGFIIGLVVILSGPLVTDLQQLTKDVTSGYEQLRAQWPNGTAAQRSFAQQLPAASDLYAAVTGPQGDTLVLTALGLTLGSFDLLGQLLISLVLSVYWSTDQEHFKRLWVSLLPLDMRARAREIWQNMETGLGAYMRSQVIQSLLALIVLSIGYQVLGLRYPTALALIGMISWLIPWLGVLLVVIPPVLVALSISPLLAVLVAIFALGVLVFLEFVVEPRLFNRRRFSSLLVVIVVLVLVDQFGLVGILIAPPFAAVIQICASQLVRPTIPATALSLTQPLTALRERLDSVQTQLDAKTDSPTPELANLLDRLTQLVAKATQG